MLGMILQKASVSSTALSKLSIPKSNHCLKNFFTSGGVEINGQLDDGLK